MKALKGSCHLSWLRSWWYDEEEVYTASWTFKTPSWRAARGRISLRDHLYQRRHYDIYRNRSTTWAEVNPVIGLFNECSSVWVCLRAHYIQCSLEEHEVPWWWVQHWWLHCTWWEVSEGSHQENARGFLPQIYLRASVPYHNKLKELCLRLMKFLEELRGVVTTTQLLVLLVGLLHSLRFCKPLLLLGP